jgi:DNA-binding transcriptional ArsR family regulator
MNNLDAVFRALNHPFRRKVLEWLANPEAHFSGLDLAPFQGVSAGMVCAKSGLSPSTSSGHLSQLERAGLIKARKIGQWVILSRNEAVLREFAALMHETFGK